MITNTLEPSDETRFKYDLLLNGLIGSDLGFCKGCPADEIANRAQAMVAALSPSELRRFANVLFLVRLSPVWADGNRSVVLELLGLPAFEPVGLRLLASHIKGLSGEKKLGAIRLSDIAALVMTRDTEFDGVYRTILSEASKMDPRTFREFAVQVMAVIGISAESGQPLDVSVLARISDRAEQEGLGAVKELIASVEEEYSLVVDEARFEEVLTRLFELDYEE